jgi:HAD superfamily hydrolase (TIGR01509 family)
MSHSRDNQLLIFDLDGTLYELEGGSYEESPLSDHVQSRKKEFFRKKLGEDSVEETLSRLADRYGQDTSLAVENEYGVDRREYFDFVWDIDPEKIINPRGSIEEVMDLPYRKAVLTTSPNIWATRALDDLGISEEFEYIQTGEADERKPKKSAYWKLLNKLEEEPEESIMIGDQENHDIIPANSIGISTVYIGGSSAKADYEIDNLDELIDIL